MEDFETLKTMTIIPNDRILNVKPYYNESFTLNHYEMSSFFAMEHNLPYIGVNSDMDIPNDGHILIKTWDDDDMAICYLTLPVTVKQYEELCARKNFLKKFHYLDIQAYNDDKFHFYTRFNGDDIVDAFLQELSSHLEDYRGRN